MFEFTCKLSSQDLWIIDEEVNIVDLKSLIILFFKRYRSNLRGLALLYIYCLTCKIPCNQGLPSSRTFYNVAFRHDDRRISSLTRCLWISYLVAVCFIVSPQFIRESLLAYPLGMKYEAIFRLASQSWGAVLFLTSQDVNSHVGYMSTFSDIIAVIACTWGFSLNKQHDYTQLPYIYIYTVASIGLYPSWKSWQINLW